MPGGRPDEYTPERAELLCQYLAQGMSLRTTCKQEGMPDPATVFSWMRKYPEFLKRYEQAKQESSDALAEELLDIADEGNPTDTQRARLRVDARKWLMAKMKPKKYGEQLDLTSKGEALPQPILAPLINGVPSNDSNKENTGIEETD